MKRSIHIYILFIVVLLSGIAAFQPASANLFESIIRTTARVSDNVPIRAIDQVANPQARRMARDMVEKGRKLDDLTYSRQLAREIETVLGTVPDPALVRSVRSMDDVGKETVLLLARGGQNIQKTIPDIALRADFLKRVDGDTLCVLGRYDGLTDQAFLFQKSLDAGQIVSPKGLRAVTMDDFGAFFKKTGDKGVEFWQKSVKPHWKLWAASGTLATIMILPDSYTDYMIEVAADGTKKIAKTAGKVISKTGETVEGTVIEVVKGFFATTTGTIVLIAGSLILAIWFLSLDLVQKFIRWLFARIRKIFQSTPPKP